jgi:predicted GIY-YIG superfamily endonuclease
MKTAWVYILRCSDSTFYTGSTTEIETRITKHELGIYPGYTAACRPVKLVWSEQFPDIYQAIAAERQIKKWSHKKKEALIRGDFDLVHELAQSPQMRDRRKARKKKS